MLGDLRTLASDLVRDDVGRVTPAQLDRAIVAAVAQYSRDRPREVVQDAIAAGGGELPLPAGARVTAVEYPVGRVQPAWVPARDWFHYRAPAGTVLRLRRLVPAGVAVRLTLSCPHELDEDAGTIPATDHEALASYAAAVLFDQIAATTSGDSNPTIPADAVNHASKPESFAKRAERLRQRYYDLLGIDVRRTRPASAVAVQVVPAGDGGGRLTHRRRR
jgi:hypothetical protein